MGGGSIPKYQISKNKLQVLYQTGIRGYFHYTHKSKKVSWKPIASAIGAFFSVNWLIHKTKPEFYQRSHPNYFIPNFIYVARRAHYIYFELSRLAQNLPTTFEYYYYDTLTDFNFYVNRKGVHKERKSVFNQEHAELMDNMLFEPIIREYYYHRTPKLLERGNLMIAYTQFTNNRYELDNFLHHKTINAADLVRGFWYAFQIYQQLANTYRYDHIIPRPNYLYEYDKMKLALNQPYLHEENKVEKYGDVLEILVGVWLDRSKTVVEKGWIEYLFKW